MGHPTADDDPNSFIPDTERRFAGELLQHCFLHFYGLDISNAAVHCAPVRFSPITFRLQEALDGGFMDLKFDHELGIAWHHVRRHNGTYKEDPGR